MQVDSPPSSTTLHTKITLANGLRVIVAPMPHVRSVTVSVYIGAGSRYETPAESGISHFIEHLCFKGTAKRPSAQLISEAIDGVGGVLNAATDREYTVYYAKVARPHFSVALDVLLDLVQAPLFDPEEMEKERKVVLEEIASTADSPGQQVDLLLDALVWPNQPLGWDVAGSEDSVSGISREMILGYIDRQYVVGNVVISVAGNVSADEVVAAVEERSGWAAPGDPGRWFAAEEHQTEPGCAILYKRCEQTHVSLSLAGLPLGHPDRYAIDLLSVLFGEGMSSRLFLELRERQGLCYDVHSYVNHFLDTGNFGLYAAVDPENGKQAVDALIAETKRLGTGVPAEELRKAKELAKGRMLLRLEDTRSVSAWLGGQEMLTGEILSPEDVVDRIEAVSLDGLARVVETLLRPDRLNLAVVGPHRSERVFRSRLAF